MIYHTLGETVTFAETFYDADGVVTTMDTVTAVVTYPGPIGTELDDGRASRRHALRDAVVVNGKAVGVIRALDDELDEVVLLSLDAIRGKAVIACGDGEFPARRGLILARRSRQDTPDERPGR